jgi:predicted transcriptional regulator
MKFISSMAGYTLKDIAEYIGVHYTTVSKVIKKSRGKRKGDVNCQLLKELLLFL